MPRWVYSLVSNSFGWWRPGAALIGGGQTSPVIGLLLERNHPDGSSRQLLGGFLYLEDLKSVVWEPSSREETTGPICNYSRRTDGGCVPQSDTDRYRPDQMR